MAKILVIDDNESLGIMVSRMLVSNGHETFVARDGKQGIQLFRECSPDLVITDLIMPDMDGVEVIAALRKLSPETKVIVMSGGGEGGSGADYLKSTDGIFEVFFSIEKPFEISALLDIVNKAIR